MSKTYNEHKFLYVTLNDGGIQRSVSKRPEYLLKQAKL